MKLSYKHNARALNLLDDKLPDCCDAFHHTHRVLHNGGSKQVGNTVPYYCAISTCGSEGHKA
jgi:hypothetical protein